MVKCECGADNLEDAKFCQECGASLIRERETESDNITEKEKWPNRLALYLGIWGVLNLFFALLFGGILLFFAVLIYASKSYKAIYAFGIVYLLLALIQLLLGFAYINYYFGYLIPGGYTLIVLSIINFAVGGYVIYKTRRLES